METIRKNNDDYTIDLAIRCKAGSQKAYTELLDSYSQRFYGYFYSLTQNRQVSEDLLSELYLKIFKSISSCDKYKFEAWMFKIASNTYYDYLRKKIRYSNALDEIKQDANCSVLEDSNEVDEKWEILHKALEQLDSGTREMIMLKYFSQMSFKEIAKQRKKPVGTVLSKVHRGIVKLREIINFGKLM